MRPYKIHKIDLSKEYPCPCRRKGILLPIALTEAFGCDRCQQIFVVKENGAAIEQLSSIYHKKVWRWTGYRWKNIYPNWTSSPFSTIVVFFLILPIFALALLLFILRLSYPQNLIFGAIVLFVAVLPFIIWLVSRR